MHSKEAQSQKSPIAFLIQAHEDPQHLCRLVQVLNGHDVFIHWDAKSGEAPIIPGATLTAQRMSVFWAGFSQVDATMCLIRSALATKKNYCKIVQISGSCYPIKAISELEQLLSNDNDHNYINSVRVLESKHLSNLIKRRIWRDAILPDSIARTKTIRQIERVLRATLNLALRFVPKKYPNYTLYHGSSWWALSLGAAKHALQVYDNDMELRHFYRYTFASDEQFIQTILRNSPFAKYCDPVIEDTSRGTYKTANLHLIHHSLTKWYDISDFEEIEKSNKFFVRKLDSTRSSALIEMIDEKIHR
jgi:hypothetical protein